VGDETSTESGNVFMLMEGIRFGIWKLMEWKGEGSYLPSTFATHCLEKHHVGMLSAKSRSLGEDRGFGGQRAGGGLASELGEEEVLVTGMHFCVHGLPSCHL
jgi:hypothetical protein